MTPMSTGTTAPTPTSTSRPPSGKVSPSSLTANELPPRESGSVVETKKSPSAASANPTADPRRKVIGLGTINEVRVAHCRVELPEHIFDLYVTQADKQDGKDPEKLMEERLIRCVGQVDQGLYFTLADKKRLEVCIGRSVGDARGALQHLEPLSRIDVSGVVIQLDPVVLKRLETRTRRGQSLEQLIREQVNRALKQYVGLMPY